MYVLLIRNTQKGVDFSYGDDINYYYCFRILRGLYVDLMRKKLKYTFTELDGLEISDANDVNYVETYEKIQKALKQIFWYDRTVYEIIERQGISISELSRKTDISYYSLYNTYTKVKSKLKELI